MSIEWEPRAGSAGRALHTRHVGRAEKQKGTRSKWRSPRLEPTSAFLPLPPPPYSGTPAATLKILMAFGSPLWLSVLAGTASRSRKEGGFSFPPAFHSAYACEDPAGMGKGSELPGLCIRKKPEGNRLEGTCRREEPRTPVPGLCCQMLIPPAPLQETQLARCSKKLNMDVKGDAQG